METLIVNSASANAHQVSDNTGQPRVHTECHGSFTLPDSDSRFPSYIETRIHSSRMRTVCCSSRLPGGGGLTVGVYTSPLPPWTEFMTYACENITFPQLRSRTVVRRRDLSPSLCNVNMFCIVQCSHWVWKPSPGPSPLMWMSHQHQYCDVERDFALIKKIFLMNQVGHFKVVFTQC